MANLELYNKLTPIVDELEAKVEAAAKTLAQDVKALEDVKALRAKYSPNSAEKLAQQYKDGNFSEQGWVLRPHYDDEIGLRTQDPSTGHIIGEIFVD